MASHPPGPRSVVSAAGTDMVSEDGDRYDPARFQQLRSPIIPPERPTSSAQGTRRGGYTHIRSSRAFGGATTPVLQSRPISQATNRLSLTHAPAVAPAFLRPMSSQRLQAQRSSQRTSRNTTRPASPKRQASTNATQPTSRNSLSSYPNTPRLAAYDTTPSRPQTRGSEFSEQQDHHDMSYYSTPSGNRLDTLGSTADSTQPLRRARAPSVEDLSSTYRYSLSKEMRRPGSIIGDGYRPGYGMDGMAMADYETPQLCEKPAARGRDKNWEHFTGNTVFCWGGRFQNTRDRPVSVITALLVIIPTIVFFSKEATFLWLHVSPALVIIYAYLFFICMSSFIHASITDPGILPRNLHPFPKPDQHEDALAIGPSMTDWTMIKSFGTTGGAMDVPTKYCKTCNIWRPPRTHHCRTCDSCVETQDHHCVWLNNCVGRRNYRYFFTFVSSASILAIYLAFVSIGFLSDFAQQNHITFGQAVQQQPAGLAMFIYGLLISIYPAALTGYHLFLMARGETTREYLNSHKFKKADRHRPYDHQNWARNWVLVLCKFRPPTYLRFKDAYIEGDQRFGPKRGHRHAPLAPEQQGGGLEMESIAKMRADATNGGPILPR